MPAVANLPCAGTAGKKPPLAWLYFVNAEPNSRKLSWQAARRAEKRLLATAGKINDTAANRTVAAMAMSNFVIRPTQLGGATSGLSLLDFDIAVAGLAICSATNRQVRSASPAGGL